MIMENKNVRAGVGILLIKDDKVLLGKRNADPRKASSELHGEDTWTPPGGKMEFGEKIIDSVKREILEETGVKAKDIELISITNDIVPDSHFVTLGFLCKNFEGQPKVMEPEEIVEWKWFSLDNLPKPIFFPGEKLINNYKEGKIYKGD